MKKTVLVLVLLGSVVQAAPIAPRGGGYRPSLPNVKQFEIVQRFMCNFVFQGQTYSECHAVLWDTVQGSVVEILD